MKFLKENFHDVLKLYVNQIGIVIFYAALLFPLETLGGEEGIAPVWSILASVLSMLFYYVLIYYVVWEIGAKDKIRVDSGRYAPTPAKGLLLGLFANTVNIVLGMLHLLFTVIAFGTGSCVNVYGVFTLLTRWHSAFYLGTALGIVGFENTTASAQIVFATLYVILPLISVGVTSFAYFMGSHEKRILYFIPQKTNKE